MKAARTIAGLFPALGFSLMPSLTCPACLPALATLLAAAGLTFLAEREYLIWFNLVALGVALLLLKRGEGKWVSWPIATAAVGAAGVMLGKFVWSSSAAWWMGFGVFMLGAAWSTFGRRSKVNECTECRSSVMENRHG